ncbi:DUF3095 domain-containing protein [Arenibacterium sp. CAU 1754]
MDHRTDTTGFYDDLPRQSSFDALSDPDNYVPLPDDWVIGTADIVGSTQAIAQGRYKTVNMVGAAVISAQINGSGGRAFPYVFGGDGAAFACPPDRAAGAADALAVVRRWANDEFDLSLRVAQVPVSAIRAAGLDVTVARYAASNDVDYAMFAGGGVSWAEARMKAGDFTLPPAPPGTRPDLTGLSCRWSHIKAQHGTILSLVIAPSDDVPGPEFSKLAETVLGIAQRLERAGHPVPLNGADVRWPPTGVDLEAKASHGDVPVKKRKRQLFLETLFAWVILRSGIPLGKFRPRHYKRQVTRNADYRKFDDGLKMTLDCDGDTVARLREVLDRAQSDGIIRYGMFQQDEAMMTCIVPSVMQDDHVHFIDGAAGGYAQAAAQIKG